MSRQMFLLALTALAITVLSGCKDPVGLPNSEVRAATLDTLVIPVNTGELFTGDVDHIREDNPANGWYEIHYQDTVKWGYEVDTGPYHSEDWRGFATFSVPPFVSDEEIPICTLHYYVAGYYEYNDDSIQVNHIDVSYWPLNAHVLFDAIDTNTVTLAKDTSPTNTGWHKVALTTQGCAIIATYGARADSAGLAQNLYTGWRYLNYYYDFWHTEVVGPDDVLSPYITVVYQAD